MGFDSAFLETTHHSGADTPSDGTVINVEGFNTVTVFIKRTAGTSTVKFYGCETEDGPNPVALMGVNCSTNAVAVSTTGADEAWEISIRGFKYFYARLDAVSGGLVTVTSYVMV